MRPRASCVVLVVLARCAALAPLQTRRLVLDSTVAAVGAVVTARPDSANAARGAAELDAEYYIKSLFKTDKRDVFDLRAPSLMIEQLPSRTIDAVFAGELSRRVAKQIAAFATDTQTGAASPHVAAELDALRLSELAAFSKTGNITLGESTGSAFECFCLYLLADKSITTKPSRLAFGVALGSELLCTLRRPTADVVKGAVTSSSLLRGAEAILSLWRARGWIGKESAVRYGDGDDDDDDDPALFPRPLRVELAKDVPARATTELERRGVLWHPDFVGLSLAAYFRDCGLENTRFDEFLLDDTYRTDPRAFVASTTLLLFPLSQ
ncbi:hypothetical protein M885DRAFT_512181 [Pelagophyceae sp. CCMP2097]|nr:hypothetical protein M885DRAFT_512181 [Pelagophyceae sp. CCMP2097]